jgi:hypothetical protein
MNLLAVPVAISMTACLAFASPTFAQSIECVTIGQAASRGEPLVASGYAVHPGPDVWGYNYSASGFNGYLVNYFHADPPYDRQTCSNSLSGCTRLIADWNHELLSNRDCNGDGYLDHALDRGGWQGSGATFTNYLFGTCIADGRERTFNEFLKMVAAPVDATLLDGVWYSADGEQLGPQIYDGFALVHHVVNDPCRALSGLQFKGGIPGFGRAVR